MIMDLIVAYTGMCGEIVHVPQRVYFTFDIT